MKRDWSTIFPQLPGPGRDMLDAGVIALLEDAREISLPAGTRVFRQGDSCDNYLLVLSGSVRVLTRAENGREIVLYRLGAGSSCVLTTSCLFANSCYPAEGITDTEVLAAAIPAARFNRAIRESAAFRDFVFASFSVHLGQLITLVEEVAFGRLDARLARYLIDHAGGDGTLRTTHQELATELGSAREVVSRLLKELEQRGLVRLGRGSITVSARDGLERVAASC